jgi:hypothetical protein
VSENLANLPVNCPRCGQPMQFSYVRGADGGIIEIENATEADVHVYRCARHGCFQFRRGETITDPRLGDAN